jgi:hypothetical protein
VLPSADAAGLWWLLALFCRVGTARWAVVLRAGDWPMGRAGAARARVLAVHEGVARLRWVRFVLHRCWWCGWVRFVLHVGSSWIASLAIMSALLTTHERWPAAKAGFQWNNLGRRHEPLVNGIDVLTGRTIVPPIAGLSTAQAGTQGEGGPAHADRVGHSSRSPWRRGAACNQHHSEAVRAFTDPQPATAYDACISSSVVSNHPELLI